MNDNAYRYDLSIDAPKELSIIKTMRESSEILNDAIDETGKTNLYISNWYDWEKVFQHWAARYPNTVFTVLRIRKDTGCAQRIYFKGLKSYAEKATTCPEFDPDKLK